MGEEVITENHPTGEEVRVAEILGGIAAAVTVSGSDPRAVACAAGAFDRCPRYQAEFSRVEKRAGRFVVTGIVYLRGDQTFSGGKP